MADIPHDPLANPTPEDLERGRLLAESQERGRTADRLRRERRLRAFYVPYDWALFLIQSGIQWVVGDRPARGKIALPVACPPLPTDAIVVAITYEPSRDCFLIVLASQSWEPAPPGNEIPLLHPNPSYEAVHMIVVSERPEKPK